MSTSTTCRALSHSLFKVFVLPALSNAPVAHTTRIRTGLLRLELPMAYGKPAAHRTISNSAPRLASSDSKARLPEKRRPRDEEIKYRAVQLVDPGTGKLQPTLLSRRDVLQSYDPKTHYLEQLSNNDRNDPNFVPVCKIVCKKEAYAAEKARKLEQKEAKKTTVKSSAAMMKTIELNWAIDANDLKHRLDRLKDFLEEGRRVEVVLARKKRGRRATVEECEGVLQKLDECIESVPGASEMVKKDKPAQQQSKLGGFMAKTYVRREGKQNSQDDEAMVA